MDYTKKYLPNKFKCKSLRHCSNGTERKRMSDFFDTILEYMIKFNDEVTFELNPHAWAETATSAWSRQKLLSVFNIKLFEEKDDEERSFLDVDRGNQKSALTVPLDTMTDMFNQKYVKNSVSSSLHETMLEEMYQRIYDNLHNRLRGFCHIREVPRKKLLKVFIAEVNIMRSISEDIVITGNGELLLELFREIQKETLQSGLSTDFYSDVVFSSQVERYHSDDIIISYKNDEILSETIQPFEMNIKLDQTYTPLVYFITGLFASVGELKTPFRRIVVND